MLAAVAVPATGHRLLTSADAALAAGDAGQPDLDADELTEVREDATGEPGVRERAETR